MAKTLQLRGFEFAKAITLVLEPFTMENDLLTPTYKVRVVPRLLDNQRKSPLLKSFSVFLVLL